MHSKKLIITALMISLLFVIGCSDLPMGPGEPGTKTSSGAIGGKMIEFGDIVDENYASPWDIFNDNILIFTTSPNDVVFDVDQDQANINLLPAQEGGYIYKYGYIYKQGTWQEYTFPQSTISGSNWIPDSAVKTYSLYFEDFEEGENHVLAYSCKKYNNEWKCGCKEENDCGYWMLQTFNIAVSNCESGAYKCEDNILYICSNDEWAEELVCTDSEECDAELEECVETCEPGTYICESNTLYECLDNEWAEKELCVGFEECDAELGECVFRCDQPPDTYNCWRNVLYVCLNNIWVEELVCTDSEECDPDLRECVLTCEQDTFMCEDNILYICSDNEWVGEQICTDSEKCDPDLKECVSSLPPEPVHCGNGICQGGETAQSCPEDCGELPTLNSNSITDMFIVGDYHPAATGVFGITKGIEKNGANGAPLIYFFWLNDPQISYQFTGSYTFADGSVEEWYYEKYGENAEPNHLSIIHRMKSGSSEYLDQEVIIMIDIDQGQKNIYLPILPDSECNDGTNLYISEDGSTYYSRTDHGCGRPDLSPEEAIVPDHLAKAAVE